MTGERVTTGSEPRRWRVGRKYGIHIYEQVGPEPSDDDIPVATAQSRGQADRIVAAYNEVVEPGHDEQTEDVCGRLLVGQSDDTYDPTCGLPSGHVGRCMKVIPAEDATKTALAADANLTVALPEGTELPGEWQPDPRTVAAVVEEVDRWYHGKPPIHKPLLEHLAERFKPSAPGGDR